MCRSCSKGSTAECQLASRVDTLEARVVEIIAKQADAARESPSEALSLPDAPPTIPEGDPPVREAVRATSEISPELKSTMRRLAFEIQRSYDADNPLPGEVEVRKDITIISNYVLRLTADQREPGEIERVWGKV